MYLLFKILSFIFIGVVTLLVFRFVFLLLKGKSETRKEVIKLLWLFLFAVFFIISYVIVVYKARNLYMEKSLNNGNFYIQDVIFTGMKDGPFTRNGQPKDSYFTYTVNNSAHKVILNSDLGIKAKQLKVGDKVKLKYINGELFYNSIIVWDINE